MPLDHILQPHRLWDSLFPLTAIRRAVRPPVFPLKPQTYYFANLYQLITNGYYQDFDEEVMEILLEEVGSYVIDGATTNGEGDSLYAQAEKLIQLDIGRGLVRTLMLAANSDDRHGPRIKRFLEKHRWIYDITSINPDEMPAINKGSSRRRQRRQVREALEKSREFYADEVKEHSRSKIPSLVEDLFKVRSKSRNEASGPGGPASRVKKDSRQGSVDFDPEGGTVPLTPAPAGSTPSSAPAAAMSADRLPSIIDGAHVLTAEESSLGDPVHLGSFWKEEEPPEQEVIVRPISARELRRRRARSQGKKGQVIIPGARPLPPGSANVPQIILATEAAAKPFLP